jgi:osmoprotectant transport system permease protein
VKTGFLSIVAIGFMLAFTLVSQANSRIIVGSKIFTESYILGEIAAQSIEKNPDTSVDRKLGMGSTGMLFESLKSGAIDVYPDYSGTLAETILKNPKLKKLDEIRTALKPLGLTISDSLGFNNTYALAVSESFAEKNNLHTVSDLLTAKDPIRAAFSYEFMDRSDGYNGLIERYGLQFSSVSRMEHSLVYQAISENAVDVIEVYSTDANVNKFKLRVLRDDLDYFPSYQAVWVARTAFVEEHPGAWQDLRQFEDRIDENKIRSMNAEADLEKTSFQKIASKFLGSKQTLVETSRASVILERTKEHLWLVGVSLLFSILIGLPLGIFAAKYQRVGQGILIGSALIQTIPTLALLCFLIPVFGVGLKPALVALCLYSLLPVVLNTFTGIRAVDPKNLENAKAFGLNSTQILFEITLPLSRPMILAGLKTATIVSIGTATLAALIGAGGYGTLIISGLSLNDIPTILMGAVPAAAMALLAHFMFELLNMALIPKGLRR